MKNKITLLILFNFFGIFTAAGQIPSYVPANGLVGWWPFNGNANDESGSGYNGNVIGASLSTDRFNAPSSCYEFQGQTQPGSNNTSILIDNVINIPNYSVTFTNQITISVWANIYTTSNSEFLQRRTSNNIDYAVGASSGVAGLHFGAVGTCSNPNSIVYNSWHQIVYSYDGNMLRIYTDGVLGGQQSGSGLLSNNTSTMNFGKYIYYGGLTHHFFYNGKLDDIGIWNRALTQSEIQQLYLSQNPCTLSSNFFAQDTISGCGNLITLDAGNAGASYSWNTGDSTQTINVNSSGWYSCTVSQGANCTASDSVFVSLVDAQIVNNDTTVCSGNPLQLSATGSGAISSTPQLVDQFTMTFGGPFSRSVNTVVGATYTMTISGVFAYSCDAFGQCDAAFAFNQPNIANHQFTVWNGQTIRPTPDVYNPSHVYTYSNLVATQTSQQFIFTDNPYFDNCGSLDFSISRSTPSISYLWSTGSTTPSITVTPSQTTTYYVTVSNGISTCTDSVTVTVNNINSNLFAQDTIAACGASFTLDAGNAVANYTWSTGATTQSISVEITGWYSCTVTQGSCTATDSVFVSLVNANIVQNDTTVCSGTSVTLAAGQSNSISNSSAIFNPGLPNPWNYPSPADGGYIPLGTFGTPSVFSISCYINPSDVQAGIAIIMDCNHGSNLNWVIQNFPNISSGSNWSFGALQFTLTTNTWQHLLITYDNGQKKAYVNGILQATATENILWSGNPGLFLGNWPEGARRFHGGIDELYITYDLQQTSNFTPPSTITTTYPNTFGLWHFDEGQGTSTLKSTGTSYPLNNWIWQNRSSVSSVNYLWSTGATTASINVSPSQTTTYYVTISNGISACTDSVTVTVNAASNNLFTQDTIAACGASFTLDAGNAVANYTWSTGATTQSISVDLTGWYSCTGTQGACTATDSVFVSLVDVQIVNNDTSICLGSSITLNATANGAGSNSGSLSQSGFQQGLIAWWPFNGNANDLSGNGFNGTLQNGVLPTTDRFGAANSAYLFDGVDDHISLPGQLNNGQTLPEFTISCWFNKNSASEGILWAKSGFWKEVVLYTTSQNQVGFFYAYPTPQAYYGLLVSSPFALNTWNHIVFMQKNSVFYAYLNGQLVQTGPSNALINWAQDNGGCSTGENFIGMGRYCQSFYYNPFSGKIDDMAIWNRALTSSEAQSLYGLNNLSTLWSTGATTASINVTPTQTTTYYVTISNGISTCTDSVTVTVVPGSTAYYADNDNDNYGDSLLGYFCAPPAGGIALGGDCDGTNPAINPGAAETCNGVDDDCDGAVDDGLAPVLGSISGPAVQCIPLGQGGAGFKLPSVAGASNYQWTVPAGMQVLTGQGTDSITVFWNLPPAHDGIVGPLSVTVTGACGQSTASVDVHLQISIPVRPSSISGAVRVCPGDTGIYSVYPVARARTYNWTMPSGMSIVSGAGSNIVTVAVGQGYTGGSIGVSAENACGIGAVRTKTVLLNNPATPTSISGMSAGLCGMGAMVYSVPLQPFTQVYQWTVPSGVTLLSGQGTNSITADISGAFGTGNLSVVAQNNCGSSPARILGLKGAPAQAGTISGPQNICPGAINQAYSVNTVAGATTYTWTAFSGVTIASGQGTKNITVNYPFATTTGQSISVVAGNACGNAAARSLSGINLSPGNCTRVAGSDAGITLYPNPAQDLVELRYEGDQPERIELYNMLGEKVYDSPWRSSFTVSGLAAGLYLVRISGAGETEMMRLEVVH